MGAQANGGTDSRAGPIGFQAALNVCTLPGDCYAAPSCNSHATGFPVSERELGVFSVLRCLPPSPPATPERLTQRRPLTCGPADTPRPPARPSATSHPILPPRIFAGTFHALGHRTRSLCVWLLRGARSRVNCSAERPRFSGAAGQVSLCHCWPGWWCPLLKVSWLTKGASAPGGA